MQGKGKRQSAAADRVHINNRLHCMLCVIPLWGLDNPALVQRTKTMYELASRCIRLFDRGVPAAPRRRFGSDVRWLTHFDPNRPIRRNVVAAPLARNRTVVTAALPLIMFLLGLGGCTSGTPGTDPPSSVAPAITTQPSNHAVTAGQTATFTVVATGTAPLSYQWQKNGTNITGATSAIYTTPATTTADSGSTFRVIVSNSAGSVTSNTATLTVNPAPLPSTVSVLTYHNDNARTGLNPNETILTTLNVNSATFGNIGTMPVDGLVDAEPLYVGNLTVGGKARNVVFVATEHDSVYAFDADTFSQLWHTRVLGTGESPSDDRGCVQIRPEIGITSTPVIDLNQGPNGTIFVVAMSKNGSSYFHRLHALDLTTGAEIGTPTTIQATFPGSGANSSNGQVAFDPKQYKERAALLLLNGVIYTTWASHCDFDPYTGWIMGYSESTLTQTSVLNVTPNGSRGAIWMSGGGPAADLSGNIYLLDANGTFDTNLDANDFPVSGDYGNAFLKLATGGAPPLKVADYFNMHDTVDQSNADWDFGSGGAVVLVDMSDGNGTTWHLAVGAGKDSRIYVVNRDSMGKFNATTDQVYQEVTNAFSCVAGATECVFSTPAFFNNTLYYGAVGDTLKALPFRNAKLVTPASSHSPATFGYPGTTPSISANGTSNGIVWAIEGCSSPSSCTGTLHAYDATDLSKELFNSNQNQPSGPSNQFSTNADCKFVTPVIANGKVYVGTGVNNSGTASGAVVVFGLLP